MRIDQLAQVDLEGKWITCTRYGEISIQKKDSVWFRWFKTLVDVLTFRLLDIYGKIRINRLAHALLEHYKHEVSRVKVKTHYITVIGHILDLQLPILKGREELYKVLKKIRYFEHVQ